MVTFLGKEIYAMKHNTKLSVKEAEKRYGKMPPVIPEVIVANPDDELAERQVKARLKKIEREVPGNEQ